MTAISAAAIHKAILAGSIKANLQGVALGDGWLDPIACMQSYAPYFLALSLIDEEQAAVVANYADEAAAALAQNNGTQATNLWGEQQNYIGQACDGCNWYNSINSTDTDAEEAQLNINCAPGGSFYSKVQSVIPPSVSYGSQSGTVFNMLSDAFMRPGVWAVEYLLSQGLHVNVYSGQLDAIVDVLCTETWINSMTWPGLAAWKNQSETNLVINGIPQGFYRSYQNFNFYRIFRAGHMVTSSSVVFSFLL